MSRIWAQPTWYFFHTFAEKINKKFYESNQGMCFNIIRQICFNLPCPECRKHASNYINKISLHSVKTKEDLIFVLIKFAWRDFISNLSSKSLRSKYPLSFMTFNIIYLFPFLVVLH